MTDKVADALAPMNPAQRCAYLAGLSHAYTDVFDTFKAAFEGAMACDMHEVFQCITERWKYLRDTHIAKPAEGPHQ